MSEGGWWATHVGGRVVVHLRWHVGEGGGDSQDIRHTLANAAIPSCVSEKTLKWLLDNHRVLKVLQNNNRACRM